MAKQGNIQISSENMMPIIKKWLYSDKDIFLREIVANGVDAITKFKKLVGMGEASEDEGGKDERHEHCQQNKRFLAHAGHEFALYDDKRLVHGFCC